MKYDPKQHIIGRTYWDPETNDPVKFKWYLDNAGRISIAEIDARRYSYMVNFGGSFSRIRVTQEKCGWMVVSDQRLFLDRKEAERKRLREAIENDKRDLFGDIS